MSTQGVYYLYGVHEPREIIKEWLEANEWSAQHTSNLALHARFCSHGSEFCDASYEILGPFEPAADDLHNPPAITQCPLCGASLDGQALARHLPECNYE